jgi:hypothetical protein
MSGMQDVATTETCEWQRQALLQTFLTSCQMVKGQQALSANLLTSCHTNGSGSMPPARW